MGWWVERWVEMPGRYPCGPYLGASARKKHSSRGPSLAPSLLEAHAPRPQFGAFRVGASAPCSLRFGPRVGTLGIEPPPELLRHPRGQKSSRRPLGRWRLPRAHFKNHFENRPSPSPAHKRPSTPGGPISTNARGEPHPSGAPYKKPNPNSRFFGVAQRPDTPLRFRFHTLQESPAVKHPRPVSFDWPFHFSIFPPKIGTFFTPPYFRRPTTHDIFGSRHWAAVFFLELTYPARRGGRPPVAPGARARIDKTPPIFKFPTPTLARGFAPAQPPIIQRTGAALKVANPTTLREGAKAATALPTAF